MKDEIDYNDVDTFPKFARVVVRLLQQLIMLLMRKTKIPVLKIGGNFIFHPMHVMAILGIGVRKERELRSRDEIEYLISKDGTQVLYLEEHIQAYIDKRFVSSRSQEGKESRKERKQRFKSPEAKMGYG